GGSGTSSRPWCPRAGRRPEGRAPRAPRLSSPVNGPSDTARTMRLLDVAREAVLAAAGIARAVQRGEIAGGGARKKDDSPVTIADFAGQAIVVHTLRRRLGECVVVGEESAAHLREDAALRSATLAALRLAWPDASDRDLLDAVDHGAADPPAQGG